MKALDSQMKADPRLDADVKRGIRVAAELAGIRQSPHEAQRASPFQKLTDILSDQKSTIMEKLSALAKMAFDMIQDAFSGFMKTGAQQDRDGNAPPVAKKSADAPGKNDTASPEPAMAPQLKPEQTSNIEESTSEKSESFDMAQAETTLFYQDAPIRGPEWFQQAAQTRANMMQRLPGTSEWTIGNGVGSLDQLTPQERARKEDEEALERLENTIDDIEQEYQRRQEREEYSRSLHRYGDVEKTGAEWAKFADTLQNSPWLKKQSTDQMKKDGKTPKEADDLYQMMILRARMNSMPESDWTPEMRELAAKLKADPKLDADIQKYTKHADDRTKVYDTSLATKNDGTASTPAASGSDLLAETNGMIDSSVARGTISSSAASWIMAASGEERPFPSAPNLTDHHRQAVAALAPLDSPKLPVPTITPPTPPGGGFAV